MATKIVELSLDIRDAEDFDIATFLLRLKEGFLDQQYPYLKIRSGKIIDFRKGGDD